jgi:hypothetical protein
MYDIILVIGLILWFTFIVIQYIGGFEYLKEYLNDTLEKLQKISFLMYVTAFLPLIIMIFLLIGNST